MNMNTRKKRKLKKRTRTKSNKVNCSPKPDKSMNQYSCYTERSILKLREKWNARHPDNQIVTRSPKEVHKTLSNLLKNACSNEACWLKQSGAFGTIPKDSDLTESFAPESPAEWNKNPNEWLSSVDIMKVMKQYEKAYHCFEFIGPTPINFDTKKLHGECVWNELCHFNLKEQINKGKTKIGIIFNTDKDTGPGQHWISMFINLKKNTIFFFDSVGDPAPKEVMVLVKRIQEQGNQLGIHLKYDSNEGIEHQYGNTECGVYSLYFIVHMLEDKITKEYLKTHILKDKYIEQFRRIYFNPSM
jgi:hypothetical protein